MPKPKFPLRMVVISSLLYISIFVIAVFYNIYVIIPIKAMTAAGGAQAVAVANSIVTSSVKQAGSIAANVYNIELIVGEIIVLSIIAILEMKFKIISKLINHPAGKIAFFSAVAVLLLWFFISSFGLLYGLLAVAILGIVSAGVGYILEKFSKNNFVMAMMVLLIYMLTFMLLTSTTSLVTRDFNVQVTIDFGYLIVTFALALLTMKMIADRTHLKLALNAVAPLTCVVTAIFFGLNLNPYFLLGLLLILAVYDFIAVFITKHMLFLAQQAFKNMMPALFVFGDETALTQRLAEINSPKPIKKSKVKGNVSILGVGDISLISMCFCSAIFYDPNLAPFMLAGAIIGISACGYALSTGKFKNGIPALIFLVPSVLIMTGIGILL